MNLIVGGTGTLGQELARQLLKQGEQITIFSRDELKQQEMRSQFREYDIKFVVGDIRDKSNLFRLFRDVRPKSVFHVAALKHVDVLEANPEQAVLTNVLGTINVADACQEYHARFCALSSTDKAVGPINAYGASKMLAEKIFFNRNGGGTQFSVFRWGNIVGSRGSAVQSFAKSIANGDPVNLTHKDMTRFWLTIEDAAKFMIDNYRNASISKPMIPPCKSAAITSVCESLGRLLASDFVSYKDVGIRPGEKLHESLTDSLHSDSSTRYTERELDDLMLKVVVP